MKFRAGTLRWALALGAALGVGCGGESEPTAASGPTIGFVMKTLNNPFFIDMERGAKAAAAERGARLIVQAPERELDIEKQMQIIENLIERRVDALCVTPSGSREIVSAIVKANAAGVPALVVDTRVDAEAAAAAGARVLTFIGSDNEAGGRLAGRKLVELLGGRGRVVVLEGIPGHETGDARLRGFRQALASAPEIEIVASQTAHWERDQGFTVMQNLLQAHPDVDGVFACNDMMALGAIEAIAAAGRTDRVRVVGFDAIDDARQAIREGRLAGSVAQHPEAMGRMAVEMALKALAGETLPPEIATPVEVIDAGNVAAADP